ncbi:hypothetical protein D3C84_1048310 [compost metagenome]
MLADVLQDGGRVELDPQAHFGRGEDREQQVADHGVDVKQRQHHQHAFVALMHQLVIVDVGQEYLAGGGAEVGVGKHGALGQAGGATGVLQHGDTVFRIRRRVFPVLAVVIQQLRQG